MNRVYTVYLAFKGLLHISDTDHIDQHTNVSLILIHLKIDLKGKELRISILISWLMINDGPEKVT